MLTKTDCTISKRESRATKNKARSDQLHEEIKTKKLTFLVCQIIVPDLSPATRSTFFIEYFLFQIQTKSGE